MESCEVQVALWLWRPEGHLEPPAAAEGGQEQGGTKRGGCGRKN